MPGAPPYHSLLWRKFCEATLDRPTSPSLLVTGDGGHVFAISAGSLRGHCEALSSSLRLQLPRAVCADHGSAAPLVGVLIERSADYVAAVLAALSSGMAFVPLDPAWPAARLRLVVEECAPVIVVTRAGGGGGEELVEAVLSGLGICHAKLPPLPSGTRWLPDAADVDGCGGAAQLRLPLGAPSGPALPYFAVIYTSGSTSGSPLGVLCTEAGALARIAWGARSLPLDPAIDVCCLRTSPAFVDSVFELFCPLLGGVPLAVPPCGGLPPLSFIGSLRAFRVTRLVAVPSLLRLLLPHLGDDGAHPPLRLRLVISSGEGLHVDLWRRLTGGLPQGCRVVQLYGCTEASGDCAFFDPRAYPGWEEASAQAALADRCLVPAGWPLDCARVLLLPPVCDSEASLEGRWVPEMGCGEVGEVCIAGELLALGYLGRPQATAERFSAVRLGDDVSLTTVFRTGDLAVLRTPCPKPSATRAQAGMAGGALLFLRGRLDDQVKVRGAKVSLAEVEAALLASRVQVAEAAARVWPGDAFAGDADAGDGGEGPGGGCSVGVDNVIVGYVVLLGGGADPGTVCEGVRREAARLLPPAAVPVTVIALDSLPTMHSSGKLDRQRLPRPPPLRPR